MTLDEAFTATAEFCARANSYDRLNRTANRNEEPMDVSAVSSQQNDMFLKAMTMMCDTMKQITERQMTASAPAKSATTVARQHSQGKRQNIARDCSRRQAKAAPYATSQQPKNF